MIRALACGVLVGLSMTLAAEAQPDPTFRASCGELRARLATLEEADRSLMTIQVVGALTRVRFDGAVAYLSMCSRPHPEVVCVSYSIEGRAVGDIVVVSGALELRGPDRVLLDPCLHIVPDKAPG